MAEKIATAKQHKENTALQQDRFNLTSLIYPLFVKDGKGIKEEIPSMPSVYRFSIDTLTEEAGKAWESGISTVLLFGLAEKKDEYGSEAYRDGNIVSKAVSVLKKNFPTLIIITDVCLCAYTSSGHCGILKDSYSDTTSVHIDEEATLLKLATMALSHAAAGADYVAPSAMVDEQVKTIRHVLDKSGYQNTKIMGYSTKFASQFYGPFRDAANSAPEFGDRKTYQVNYADRKRALTEVGNDINEGADIVMIKPALCYLDVIREAKTEFNYPLAAYNVSGEYAMVKMGARLGFWDERKMVSEIITSIKRAGADIIITYHALDIAQWLSR